MTLTVAAAPPEAAAAPIQSVDVAALPVAAPVAKGSKPRPTRVAPRRAHPRPIPQRAPVEREPSVDTSALSSALEGALGE